MRALIPDLLARIWGKSLQSEFLYLTTEDENICSHRVIRIKWYIKYLQSTHSYLAPGTYSIDIKYYYYYKGKAGTSFNFQTHPMN